VDRIPSSNRKHIIVLEKRGVYESGAGRKARVVVVVTDDPTFVWIVIVAIIIIIIIIFVNDGIFHPKWIRWSFRFLYGCCDRIIVFLCSVVAVMVVGWPFPCGTSRES